MDNGNSDLKIRSYKFSVSIIKFLETVETKRIHFSLMDQLLRSATSIGANIFEAKSASSKRDFIKFYEISLKSANETLYWICLLRDSGLIDGDKAELILKEAKEISNMLGASLLTMKKKKQF